MNLKEMRGKGFEPLNSLRDRISQFTFLDVLLSPAHLTRLCYPRERSERGPGKTCFSAASFFKISILSFSLKNSFKICARPLSFSIAVNCLHAGCIASVKAPRPGPISNIKSVCFISHRLIIASLLFLSIRKFWPSLLFIKRCLL